MIEHSGMMSNPRVVAVVVTFQPDGKLLCQILEALEGQVGSVVVVDNGSSEDVSRHCPPGSAGRVAWKYLGRNTGVAGAQNAGIREAMQKGATHVLLLDHDSIPAPGMVSALVEAYRVLSSPGRKVAAVGPRYKLRGTDQSSFFVRFGALRFKKIFCDGRGALEHVRADFLISSGCLIPVESLSEIGLMDESLFVDHVDTEWFLRARACGYESYGVARAVMEHCLGDRLARLPFLGKRGLPVHTPSRFYYIFRNSFLLYRRGYVSRSWKLNDAIRLFLLSIIFATIIPPRLQYCRMMTRGVLDGLRGRSGRYPDDGGDS